MCRVILGRFRIKYRCNLQLQLPLHPLLRLFLPLNRKQRPKIISNPHHSNNIKTEDPTGDRTFLALMLKRARKSFLLNTSRLMGCVIIKDLFCEESQPKNDVFTTSVFREIAWMWENNSYNCSLNSLSRFSIFRPFCCIDLKVLTDSSHLSVKKSCSFSLLSINVLLCFPLVSPAVLLDDKGSYLYRADMVISKSISCQLPN